MGTKNIHTVTIRKKNNTGCRLIQPHGYIGNESSQRQKKCWQVVKKNTKKYIDF